MKTNLQQRQADTVAGIEKNLGINLTQNNQKKEVKKMTKQQDVVTNVKEKKATNVTPVKVNLGEVEKQARGYLEELQVGFNGVDAEVETTKIGMISLKQKSRFLIGIRYQVTNSETTFSIVVRESLKNFSKDQQGKYQPDNWLALYPINGASLAGYQSLIKASRPKAKAVVAKVVAKPVAKKKNKPVKKTI